MTEGEVELLRTIEGREETIRALGAGSYFGHTQRNRRIQETVRARSAVRAVTVRSDQAHRLQGVLASLAAATAADSQAATAADAQAAAAAAVQPPER